jgi:SAM-dependent methyltransferase
MRTYARRAFNLARKLKSGLTPSARTSVRRCRTISFVAHLSINRFASQFARGARVLDVGCGAGYGSEFLRNAGATHVLGIDLDPRNIRYATRHYPAVRFRQGDAEQLPRDLGIFDLIIASNVLEHLRDVRPALDTIRDMTPGRVIIAVPPIDDASLRANEAIPYHRSNHRVGEWIDLLASRFADVRTYRHYWREGVEPDFSDPFPSRLTADDFLFEEIAAEDLLVRPCKKRKRLQRP